jgi:hypothetical protein
MRRLILKTSILFVLLFFLSLQASESPDLLIQDQILQEMKTQDISKSLKISPHYGQIPLYFIPNEGQVDERALFYAKASRYTLWLTKEGLIFDSIRREYKDKDKSHITCPIRRKNIEDYPFERDVSRMMFLNSNKEPEVVPIDQTEHGVNYFIGNDKSKWRTNIQTSRVVLYKELYRNIDLKIYGVEQQIEYDFIVKPGGEVSDIGFAYRNVKEMRIDKKGNLVLKTEFGKVTHAKPVSYQEIERKRIIEVDAGFKQIENNTYGFEVKDYDKNYELIIDPVILAYSTYLGGSSSDNAYDIAVDSEGAAYVTGETNSLDFPIKNAMQGSNAGESDVFISKMNPSGTSLVYSTYLGGSGGELGSNIAIDSEGAVYVAGITDSTDFPIRNPFQGGCGGCGGAFLSKINSSGNDIVYSTCLGCLEFEWYSSMAVDSEGAVFVAGDMGWNGILLAKIDPTGSDIVYTRNITSPPGPAGSGDESCFDITVDSEGAVYVLGYSPWYYDYPPEHVGIYFIDKLNTLGSWVYSHPIMDSKYWGYFGSIAVDAEGAAYVTGETEDWDGDKDVFIIKVDPAGAEEYYLPLTGSDYDYGCDIAVDSEGAAYVTGKTYSVDFPTQHPIQGH